MKINLTGEIKIPRELHLVISNYIVNLFKESKFLSKVTEKLDKRFKLYEKDNNYILRSNVSKISHTQEFDKKRKLNLSEGFRGLLETEDNIY